MTSFSTETREIRKFGIIALVFFGALCALGIWQESLLPIFLFGLLAALGIGFILAPARLKPLYVTWLKVAHRIGQTVTIVILSLAYYLVITPSAWIKRLFGGRPLPLMPDKDAPTYWVPRTEPAQPRARFIKRY